MLRRKSLSIFALIALFLTATTTEASYAKLAKDAELSYKTMEEIVKKVVKIKTTTDNYHTKIVKVVPSGAWCLSWCLWELSYHA